MKRLKIIVELPQLCLVPLKHLTASKITVPTLVSHGNLPYIDWNLLETYNPFLYILVNPTVVHQQYNQTPFGNL